MTDKKAFKPCDLVLFGALGDLSRRKLLISLYRLENANLIEPDTRIIGVDRHEHDNAQFVAIAYKSLQEFLTDELDDAIWQRFSARLAYLQIDLTQAEQYKKLKTVTDSKTRVLVNYFAVSPFLFKSICQGLHQSGILTPESRMVMEKPIGHNLKSSKDINDEVAKVFNEDQVFRIDHYLGKETVLNLLALRFANSIFTTNWNHNTIDHIQITVAEEVGIEGRWEYFDKTGQLRDMVQNHLLQILTFIAMEPPVNLEAESIHNEKIKVLKALRPITVNNVEEKTVRGQYTSGYLKGNAVPGYLEEEGANTESTTESFVALRVDIDNWRWAGVPFYLRTGKRMFGKRTEIVVYFKQLPHNIFKDSFRDLPPNKLIIHLQPNEGVEIEMLNKIPGIDEHIKLKKTKLDLSFSEAFKQSRIFGGYEKLVLEAMRGNPTLFLSRAEIEQAWAWIDSIQDAWRHSNSAPKSYPAGSWGPVASVALVARDGRAWEE
ncbi:glucose-6-phosphate dehydrogenase [Methylovulum psychrotolerans]|uniref:Glucose-6-phosphate 1-dehydrogenase n=1 Tax=Methylovulum psychrotolerans TaxID=1704499 RepID=A0A1Z4BZV7_9GAMM|nr:glucose-6-phosphate dehydrogenase [Methylovulum psychrotolerans]ASF46791.1 glucose-6-phosphate dehydrogenase [Methylovulum psychrotolerans]MBT9099252.1 glucose-6-phosphate dehydrogenase [Methylovulum psychrotolerans]POZ50747.1 glucose-6-phosphate dehydrogenase [Methylovulum psychrotolerans]